MKKPMFVERGDKPSTLLATALSRKVACRVLICGEIGPEEIDVLIQFLRNTQKAIASEPPAGQEDGK